MPDPKDQFTITAAQGDIAASAAMRVGELMEEFAINSDTKPYHRFDSHLADAYAVLIGIAREAHEFPKPERQV